MSREAGAPLAGMRAKRTLPEADAAMQELAKATTEADSMSREAGTRGPVTGEAGRLREARWGAGYRERSAADAVTRRGAQQIGLSAPLAGMRTKRMLLDADTPSEKFVVKWRRRTA